MAFQPTGRAWSPPSSLRLRIDKTVSPAAQLRCWEYRCRDPLVPPATAHETIELAWIDSGRLRYRIGRRRFVVEPGMAILVPSGVEHITEFAAPTVGWAIKLAPQRIDEIADAVRLARDIRPLANAGPLSSPRVLTLASLLRDEAARPAPGQLLALSGLVDALAVELLRYAPGNSGVVGDRRIRAALRLVESHYMERLGVEDLARAAGLSRHHFSRIFRQYVGESPQRYLLQLRLARAAALLRRGDCSVSEAALSSGFTQLGRFSGQFREWSGHSPSVYRRGAARSG